MLRLQRDGRYLRLRPRGLLSAVAGRPGLPAAPAAPGPASAAAAASPRPRLAPPLSPRPPPGVPASPLRPAPRAPPWSLALSLSDGPERTRPRVGLGVGGGSRRRAPPSHWTRPPRRAGTGKPQYRCQTRPPLPALPASALCVGDLRAATAGLLSLALLPHPDQIWIPWECWRKLRQAVWGLCIQLRSPQERGPEADLRWAPALLKPTATRHPPQPCRCQDSDSDSWCHTSSDTTPNTHGALKAESWIRIRHALGETHTGIQTHTCHGVGQGWGLPKPYTGQGVHGKVGALISYSPPASNLACSPAGPLSLKVNVK